jgi:hypothetical protein
MQPKYLRSSVNHEMIDQWVKEGLISKTIYSDQIIQFYPLLSLDELEPLSHLLCDHDYEGIEAQFVEICERNSYLFNQENLLKASKRDHPTDYYQARGAEVANATLKSIVNFQKTSSRYVGNLAMVATRYVRYQTEEFLAIAAILTVLGIGSYVATMPFRTPYDAELTLERSDKDTSNGSFVQNYNYSDTEILVSPKEDFKSIELQISFIDTPDLAFFTVTKGEFYPINTSLRFDLEKRLQELKFVKPSRVRLLKVNR